MNQQETEQFAALRMHVAHLHNALSAAVAHQLSAATGPIPTDLQLWQQALEMSEPHVKDLLAEADRDAKLVAARADAQSARDELAKSTARLAKIEPVARNVVEVYNGPHDAELVRSRISDLAEALADSPHKPNSCKEG